MSATAEAVQIITVTRAEIQSLLDQVETCNLPDESRSLNRAIIRSYVDMVAELGNKKVNIARLKEILFGAQTETKKNVMGRAGKTPATSGDEKKKKKKRPGHGRTPAKDYHGTTRVEIPHATLKPGDSCEDKDCSGTIYARKPRLIVRIHGVTPFGGETYEQGCLRCGLCGKIFRAEMPPEVGEKKYDETVPSMAAVLRYGKGLPMNRIEELQKDFGVPLPASMQWTLMRDAAVLMEPAYRELIRQAAQGEILYNDDTPMRILDYIVEQNKRKARGEKPPERTGTFTSGIVSELGNGRRIVLYFTGRNHAGENLADVLAEREAELGPPIQMSDGLDRNAPREIKTIVAKCLAHARRQFADVVVGFPVEVEHVLEELSLVYKNDALTKVQGMSAEERLRFHQEKSGPVMERFKTWLQDLLKDKLVEPNSGLGRAIAYTMNLWEALTLFLREAGAPLDNTLTERMLKKAIMHRKNSMFYRNKTGADVGDLYMALIATAKFAGTNAFDYLNELQRHAEEVAATPAAWMPWNYREALGTPAPAAGSP